MYSFGVHNANNPPEDNHLIWSKMLGNQTKGKFLSRVVRTWQKETSKKAGENT